VVGVEAASSARSDGASTLLAETLGL
jgi:hypothetical protein